MADLPAGCCPHCGSVNRESEAIIGPDEPVPGALMICECAGVSIYVGEGQARKPTEDEWLTMKDDPVIIKAQIEAIQASLPW